MQTIDIDNEKFIIVPMSGHTPQMIGVITPDKVLYAGDALFGPETFNKHGVLFYTNIGNTLNSLASLKDLDIRAAVLYHGGIVDSKQALLDLADQHVAKLEETHETLLGYINTQGHCSLSDVTKFAMNQFHVPDNVIQYTLTETPVKAFLQFMQKKNQVNLTVQNGTLLVNSVNNVANIAKI
jgi:glyoxylase-like metal-dependent hydrolase (beta-lactamase superfamily II)